MTALMDVTASKADWLRGPKTEDPVPSPERYGGADLADRIP